jgi:hypothetical protein
MFYSAQLNIAKVADALFLKAFLLHDKVQPVLGGGTVIRAIGRRLFSRLGVVWVLSHTIMVLFGALFLGAWSRTWMGTGIAEGIGGSLIASGIVFVESDVRTRFERHVRRARDKDVRTFTDVGIGG